MPVSKHRRNGPRRHVLRPTGVCVNDKQTRAQLLHEAMNKKFFKLK